MSTTVSSVPTPVVVAPLAAPQEVIPCACCNTKKRSAKSDTCSKRCEWFLSHKCPQCGRDPRSDMAFCSTSCGFHSAHANWCRGCTIRQAVLGQQYCTDACASQDQNKVAVPQPRKKTDNASHMRLADTDAEYTSVVSMVGPEAAKQVQAVIKVAPNSLRRRQYLNYRTAVEQRMTQTRTQKYGHGGEGNEHKRFAPMTLNCNIQANRDGSVVPCNSMDCTTCTSLAHGFSLQRMNTLSHYCVNSFDVAADCSLAHNNLRAVAIVRAVIGCPELINGVEDIDQPWLRGYDSCILSDGTVSNDATYLMCDEAVEPLYIVLLGDK